MIERLFLKIRRRESPVYDRLYRIAKTARGVECPVVRPVHRLLYTERQFRLGLWWNVLRVLYHEPLFKSRCEKVGRRLHLTRGIPLVLGHLKIYLGDNVEISGVTTFYGSKQFDKPRLTIGDNSYVGYAVTIAVGNEVVIGKNVCIANNVLISGDDGHPVDPAKRRMGLPAEIECIKPVHIDDDVWIAEGAKVLKGVAVGKCSIVAAGSIVTRDVPPYTIVAGNPATVIRTIPR